MPFIDTKVSVEISAEKEKILKEKLGKAIALIPGKSESWLMLNFEDNCRIWFKGDNGDAAMVQVMLYGSASADALDRMTGEITKIISDELGIRKDRIYVKYEECKSWGWNGSNF